MTTSRQHRTIPPLSRVTLECCWYISTDFVTSSCISAVVSDLLLLRLPDSSGVTGSSDSSLSLAVHFLLVVYFQNRFQNRFHYLYMIV